MIQLQRVGRNLFGSMQIFVKTLNGKTITLDLAASDTFDRIQNEITFSLGLARGFQSFCISGQPLFYGGKATLQEAGIVDGTTLVLALECGTQVVEVATQRRGMVVASTANEVYLILWRDEADEHGEPDEENGWRTASELELA